jgi:hypothetical protein
MVITIIPEQENEKSEGVNNNNKYKWGDSCVFYGKSNNIESHNDSVIDRIRVLFGK